MNRKVWTISLVLLLAATAVPAARADAGNKAIQFSVNGPVEVPGKVLDRGTYELKLMSYGSSVAGIWSADGTEFYGMFDTMPMDYSHTAARSRVILEGSGKTSPKRIEGWLYPGDAEGTEFVYPAAHAVQMTRCGPTSHVLKQQAE